MNNIVDIRQSIQSDTFQVRTVSKRFEIGHTMAREVNVAQPCQRSERAEIDSASGFHEYGAQGGMTGERAQVTKCRISHNIEHFKVRQIPDERQIPITTSLVLNAQASESG